MLSQFEMLSRSWLIDIYIQTNGDGLELQKKG